MSLKLAIKLKNSGVKLSLL